jgi:hypothetical protein
MIFRHAFLSFFGVAFYFFGTYVHQANLLDFIGTSTEPTIIECPVGQPNTIQVALLLDTSGSMSGLIEQAKSQLWNILNQLARTTKDGQDTALEVALYEYGNPSKATQKFEINQLTPFTRDMDLVSEKLFSLTIDGGDEYCGAIIQRSFNDLSWVKGNGLKIIYIAGNEGFDQGPIDFMKACGEAVESGIIINTIYCGGEEEGIKLKWKAGAMAGKGEYMFIEHNQATVYVPTPYDSTITKLNAELNSTYIPIGKKGEEKQLNQISQDFNAGAYSMANASDRAVFKSSKKYDATDWDLVDAYQKDKSILEKAEIVTDSLQNLSIIELESKVLELAKRRVAIQEEILELDKKRRAYKAENEVSAGEATLQQSVIGNVRKLAKEKGYTVE